ncbi:hypothetical protein A2U01_0055610, partial [Trifolium medium]|nr:hypothetical protein [Trifolium medium]
MRYSDPFVPQTPSTPATNFFNSLISSTPPSPSLSLNPFSSPFHRNPAIRFTIEVSYINLQFASTQKLQF